MTPPEEFFTGMTQAGRLLRLYYEHTAFETFTDETGETVHNPSETDYRATLDGAPIELRGYSMEYSRNEQRATVITDQGTFTASTTAYVGDHSEALRHYLERRPSDGWDVAIVDKHQDADEWVYIVSITNGRLSERAEFRFSEQVARTVSDGDPPPSDEQATTVIAETIRSDKWERIKQRAESPTTLMWRAH